MNNDNFNQGVVGGTPTNSPSVNNTPVTSTNIGIPSVPIINNNSNLMNQEIGDVSVTPQQPNMAVTNDISQNVTGSPVMEVQPIPNVMNSANVPMNQVENTSVENVVENVVSAPATSEQVNTTPLQFELPNSNPTVTTPIPESVSQVNPEPVNPIVNSMPQNNVTGGDTDVSMGKFLGHMFLFTIPILGLIMLIVTAFVKKEKIISNFAKAYLLFGVIMVVFCLVFFVLFGSTIASQYGLS